MVTVEGPLTKTQKKGKIVNLWMSCTTHKNEKKRRTQKTAT